MPSRYSSNLAKYPTIKRITKSFKTHPVHGYAIECWHFNSVIKYRGEQESRKADAQRRL